MKTTAGRWIRRRALSMFLACAVLFSSVDLTAFATEQAPQTIEAATGDDGAGVGASDVSQLDDDRDGATGDTSDATQPEGNDRGGATGDTGDVAQPEGDDRGGATGDAGDATQPEGDDRGGATGDTGDVAQPEEDDRDSATGDAGDSGAAGEDAAAGDADGTDRGDTDQTGEAQDPDDAGQNEMGDATDPDAIEEPEDTEESISGNSISENSISENSLVTVNATNALGRFFAEALSEEVTATQENSGCDVYDITLSGTEAEVSFQTMERGTLVVGVYDDSGSKLVASGTAEVLPGDTQTTVAIEGSLPEYFVLRGFLAQPDSLRPLGSVYESSDYTQAMQAFYAKTTADYDSAQILNLDDDATNNFIVFRDDVHVIAPNNDTDVNKVTLCDEETRSYQIENPDEQITTLQAGDVFAYYYEDNAAIITKVSSIDTQTQGDTTVASILGEDVDVSERILFMKVGAENPKADAQGAYAAYAARPRVSVDWSIDGCSIEEDGASLSLDGIGGTSSLRVFRDSENAIEKTELEITYGATASVSGTLSKEKKWKIGNPTMPTNVPGVTVSCLLEVKLAGALTGSVNGTLSGSLGFAIEDEEVKNISKTPSLTLTENVEGTVSLGLVVTPTLKFVHEKILSAQLELEGGMKATATLESTLATTDTQRHTCEACLGITMGPYLNITGRLNFLSKTKEIEPSEMDWGNDWTVWSCYYSIDHHEFGVGECPYKEYQISVQVIKVGLPGQGLKRPVAGATVNNEDVTNAEGWVERWETAGWRLFYAAKDGETGSKLEYVTEPMNVVIVMGIDEAEPVEGNAVAQVIADSSDSSCAAITKDGRLYRWGTNSYGQLGDGTSTSKSEPIYIPLPGKVTMFTSYAGCSAAVVDDVFGNALYLWGANQRGQLGNSTTDNLFIPSQPLLYNVREVCLGSQYSAAVTDEGELYLWGYNGWGQIGNGTSGGNVTEPTQVLQEENVKEVVLSPFISNNTYQRTHTAAITEDGKLYLWGYNGSGQVGNGESVTNITSPVQVLTEYKVKEISLGANHSAAITEDGKLYLWGSNSYGQLGDGTKTNKLTPTPVSLDGKKVKSVHMGVDCSMAITEDGTLYAWGRNNYGQIGKGTEDDCYTVPQKIMENVADVTVYRGTNFSTSTEVVAALQENGDLYMWGSNESGELGNGNKGGALGMKVTYPAKVLGNVKQVSLGGGYASGFSAAITVDGSLWTWGDSIGIGRRTSVSPAAKPARVTFPTEESQSAYTLAAFAAESDPQITQDASDPARQTAVFTGLVPDDIHNIYVMRSEDAAHRLDADNLLYIGQSVSDADGSLTITYEMKEACDAPAVLCVGMTQADLAEAEVTASDIVYDGEAHLAQVQVTYGGRILTEGTDYIVCGDCVVSALGSYMVTIKGIGVYCGEKQATFACVDPTKEDLSAAEVTIPDVIYDGAEHTVQIEVMYDGQLLTEGADYEVSGDRVVTEVGEYTVVITGIGIYGGEKRVTFAVKEAGTNPEPEYGEVLEEDVPADGVIPEGLWIAGIAEEGYIYTGQAIKPAVRVYDHKTLLREGADYTVAYSHNIQANITTPEKTVSTITVTGKGNYSGKETQSFKIYPLDISAPVVDGTDQAQAVSDAFAADDMTVAVSTKAQKPLPVLYWNDKKLKNQTDYTVAYYDGTGENRLDAVKEKGRYVIRLSGVGNFTGMREVSLTVTDDLKLISKATVAKIANQPYTGQPCEPEVTVRDGKKTLDKSTHYTVTYSRNTAVGTAYVVVRGIEAAGYSGTKRVSFKITGTPMKKVRVSGLSGASFVYNGDAHTPELTLTSGDKTLALHTDYEVEWQNNQNAGTATVLLTGKNGYSGTLKKTFKIKAFHIAENRDGRFVAALQTDSVPYAKGGAKPAVTVTFQKPDGTSMALQEGRDYTLTYQNNKACYDGSTGKSPTVTIKGKGNFSGTYATKPTYRITAQNLGVLRMTASDMTYQNKKNAYAAKVTITDLDGKVLKAGTDYEKKLVYTYQNDTALDNGTRRAAGSVVEQGDIVPAGVVLSVTATGRKNYAGTLSATYRMTQASLSAASVSIPKQTYTGRAVLLDKRNITVKMKGKQVDESQYEIIAGSYQNNVQKGTASVTLRGVDNYGGTKTVKFTIKAKGFLWWWRTP